MKRKILDTNVIISAIGDSDKSPQITVTCIEQCRLLLFQCTTGNLQIVIDSGEHGSHILDEYRQQFRYYEGTYGEMFVRWILNNIMNEQYIMQIPITYLGNDEYQEFPEDHDLHGFDPRDRKFIALAVAHHQYEAQIAPIVQSADMKWKNFVSTFAQYHVEIEFICDAFNLGTSVKK